MYDYVRCVDCCTIVAVDLCSRCLDYMHSWIGCIFTVSYVFSFSCSVENIVRIGCTYLPDIK